MSLTDSDHNDLYTVTDSDHNDLYIVTDSDHNDMYIVTDSDHNDMYTFTDRKQDNVSDSGDMSISRLLFQWPSTIKTYIAEEWMGWY
jgi:hypothetical protein